MSSTFTEERRHPAEMENDEVIARMAAGDDLIAVPEDESCWALVHQLEDEGKVSVSPELEHPNPAAVRVHWLDN